MTKNCEVCRREFQDDYSFNSHLQGKQHIKNAEIALEQQSKKQRSIFVSPVPYFLASTKLINFFSQFGEIYYYRFGPNHLIIEYLHKEPVQYLLSKPIYYSGLKLNIQPRIIHDNRVIPKKNSEKVPDTINNTQDLIYDNVKSIFEVESTFNEQLQAFLDRVSISAVEIETYYEPTCRTLEEIFKNVYPKCKTYRFGSTVSGLGFKHCDLDIYVDTGFQIVQENSPDNPPRSKTTKTLFTEVKRILYGKPTLFSKIVPIPKAKTPIIRFTYIPTEISCDISFKNSLAVHNSQLMKFYFSMNPKFKPAMIVIKYWLSNYELKSGDKMSKYALSLLFIFYLQQPTVNLVPPVIELKKRCAPEIVEGWEVNFCKADVNNKQRDDQNKVKSIPEILQGFFKFYSTYDFKLNAICPINGTSISKELFNEPEILPESMDRYKDYLKTKANAVPFSINKPMCVQDPNELNHNVTANISLKYCDNFQKYCDVAYKACLKAEKKNYNNLLPLIFTSIKEVKITQKSKNRLKNLNINIHAQNLLNVGLPADFETQNITDKKAYMAENWSNLVIEIVKKFFEKILKFKIEFKDVERELKQQKTASESDVHSNSENNVIICCTGDYCFWRDRKGKGNILDPSMNVLEKEILITEKLYEELSKKSRLVKMNINFRCQIIKKIQTQDPHLILTLNNDSCSEQIFSELAAFVRSKLACVVNKTLVHMQQFKTTPIETTL